MAIRVAAAGNRDLVLTSNVSKGRNWANAISIDGVSTQYGIWQARFVHLPASFASSPVSPVIDGTDTAGTGGFGGGNDYWVRIFSDSNTDPNLRRRAQASLAGAGNRSTITIAPTEPQMALGAAHLVIQGVTNTSTTATPAWVHWLAVCEVGTANVYWTSAALLNTASIITQTGNLLAGQLFERLQPTLNRTPDGVMIEHLAVAQGNFPWDTANNRPHFDAIVALAGGPGVTARTYESLVAAQNAGTLGYANLQSGKSDLDFWWRLESLSALDNWAGAQSAGSRPFATDPAGAQTDLVDNASIAPAHWASPTLAALGLSSSSVATGSPATISITGATSGSTITLASGTLPAGMTLNSAARTITGTPTADGTFAFILRETLAGATNSPRDTALSITAAAAITLAALTCSPTTITQGAAATVNIGGATSGSTITLQSGTLPAGMTLNSAARTITGTPTATGSSSFTLRETLGTATNSPRDTGVAIQVNAASAAPTINARAIRFHGGRGGRALVLGGTYGGTTTAMQRRWVVEATATAVPGFDWAAIPGIAGGSWQISDTLPVGGPYRLEVRDTADIANSASSAGWLVGTAIALHGQSGMELALRGAGASVAGGNLMGINHLALGIVAGARGVIVKLANQRAGVPATYSQPSMVATDLVGGTTPGNVGQGTIALLNEWHAQNPGHPLLIANMAIDGTGMSSWANDADLSTAATAGHASWRFMGQIGAVADGTSGNNSGVVEAYAAALGRHIDAHAIMWTPGMSSTATGSGSRELYRQGIDARFSNAAAAPWLVFPPWRGHRNPADTSATVAKRQEHLDFAAELGARAVLCSCWPDIVMDNSGSLHAAIANPAGTPSFSPIPDTNMVGASRISAGIGRWTARAFNATVKAAGPRVLRAWYRDGGRTVIEVELGRRVRTLGGAAIANLFWISTDNGTTWGQAGFTVALSPDGTRAVLTSTGAAWAASNVRVDYARDWPFSPAVNSDESLTERLLDGVLYDNQQHRGGTNFTAGNRAGNPMVGTNRTGTGSAGVAVTARGNAKLVATERFTGARNVTVRLMSPDGTTVLRERTLTITAS